MQSCWQPIKRLLSTHIPQHIPSGSIFRGLLPQTGCREKGDTCKTICPLVENGKLAVLWKDGHCPALTSHCPASWLLGGEFITNARCHEMLKAKWMAEISNISWRAPWEGIEDWYITYSSMPNLIPRETENVSQEILSTNKLLSCNECGHHSAAEPPLVCSDHVILHNRERHQYCCIEGKERRVNSYNLQRKGLKNNATVVYW